MDNILWIWMILRHKFFVLWYGLELKHISIWRLLLHDMRKFHPVEFGAYRDKFVRKNCPPHVWMAAADDHLKMTDHHHEHWVTLREKEPIEVPCHIVYEMIADWMATSYLLTGSKNFSVWLFGEDGKSGERAKMKLHPKTSNLLHEILCRLGYDHYYNCGY